MKKLDQLFGVATYIFEELTSKKDNLDFFLKCLDGVELPVIAIKSGACLLLEHETHGPKLRNMLKLPMGEIDKIVLIKRFADSQHELEVTKKELAQTKAENERVQKGIRRN